jgi:uncharacterized protein YjeT (DUF2065 family)
MGFFVVAALVALAFVLTGLACILSPRRVQQAAKDAQRGTPWAGAAEKVFDAKAYVIMLRIVGVASLLVAAMLVTVMVLFAVGYLEP